MSERDHRGDDRSGDQVGTVPPRERTRVRRFPERAAYDRTTIRAILAAGRVCHVGFVEDGGPVVIPTTYGLWAEHLVLHGLPASRLLHTARSGVELCVAVTLLDGLVLARSAFDHSMNYRSVVVFGRAHWLRNEGEKRAALVALSEQLLPGRWSDVRPPTSSELRRTHVLALPLDEASAKIRTGPPSPPTDEDREYSAVWTGVLPARVAWGRPEPDASCPPVPLPPYLLPAPVPDRE
ncbi:MAG TPA: pyridoxamine 5'-phosphate oxidase family protein [Actinopolymorphaceae bacterium]